MTNAAELNQKFLADIMPEGNIVICPGKKSKGVWKDYVSDPDWRAKFLANSKTKDVYYSPASYIAEERKEAQVLASHVLFMDIDAGAVKQAKHGKDAVYDSWEHALKDVLEWVNWARVPGPSWVIRSGEGLHLYWVTEEAMDLGMWKPLESGLMRVAIDGDVKVDGSVSSMNELLRMPGGVHQGSGRVVEVLENASTQVRYNYLDLCRYFPPVDSVKASTPGALGVKPEHLRDGDVGEEWAHTMAHAPRNFRELLQKSLNGEGCAFIAMGFRDQATLAEEPWRAMLSIAVNCDDGEEMIHEVSNKHREYSAGETDKKAEYVLDKPYSCDKINDLCPGVCAGCPHKVKSPIVLANTIDIKELVTPTQQREKILREKKASLAPVADGDGRSSARRIVAEKIVELETLEPVMPEGYALFQSGKLIKYGKDGDPSIIYDRPFYLVERMKDDAEGDILVMNYESPQDGVREVTLSQTLMATDDLLLKTISKLGIITTTKFQKEEVVMFLKKSALEMQNRRARALRHNFGWQGSTESFVHGRHEFTTDGNIHLTSVQGGDSLVEAMQPMDGADPATWGKLAQQFMAEGFEPAMFAIGLSLGAPLFKLSDTQGGLVHMFSTVSGRGKTTAMKVALSVWGRTSAGPGGAGIMCIANDTENAIFSRLGLLGSIPTGIDELTDKRGDELRKLLYSITQGRQRDRMEGQSNGLRTNTGTWQMAVMSTGNTSVAEKLSNAGDMRDATLARLLELDCSEMPEMQLPPGRLDEWVNSVDYGHSGIVGRMVSYFVTKNKLVLRKEIEKLQTETMASLEFAPKERFWRGMMVCALAGLRLGSALGLFRFSEQLMLDYCQRLLTASRKEQREAAAKPRETLQDFLSDNLEGQVVVQSDSHIIALGDIGKVVVSKYVKDTKTLCISERPFRLWAAKQNLSVSQVDKYMQSIGATVDRVALISGATGKEARVRCWIIPNYILQEDAPPAPSNNPDTQAQDAYYSELIQRGRS